MTGLPRHPPYSRNRSDGADVLVIGAGMAGVTAARELARSGFAVTVVEGGNRVGGRLRTIHDFGPQPIEAGAEFIHGDGAATWPEVRAAGLSTRPCPLVRDTMLSLGGSARWLPTSLLHPGTWHASTILRSIARFGSPDVSAREFLERRRGGEGKAGSGRHRSAAVGRSGNEILADRRNRRSGLPQRSPRRSRGTEVSLVLTRVD